MLLFPIKSLYFLKVIIFLCIYNEIEAAGSSSSIKRTQSMKPLMAQKPIRTSTSSASSTASTSRHQHIELRDPVASTSNTKQITFEEDLQRLRSVSNINLDEAVRATNAEHLDPTRDGVYARLNRILLQYGTAVVVGSAIGAGAIELVNRTSTATTTTTAAPISTSTQEIEKLL